MRFLLDASAFYPLTLIEGGEHVLVDSYILDLTIYEVGNIIWKRAKKNSVNLEEALASLEELLNLVEVMRISPKDFSGIERVAVDEGLTFYDAAYLFYARKADLILVTEDQKLAERAGERAVDVNEALKISEDGNLNT